MESKKINQLATNVSPQTSDLTIIGDPTTGVSKKITLLQIANLFATTGTVTSVGVTETGDALTITGSPITTAGTINIGFAGAATQYVRGDGALADFPTSTGGGSSVSYYLNSSVSQGTIGGVAYRQLSKTPIAGAGTDITISANGYVASYITDSNDPALLEVPAGNFNCEFYFSVNSNSHNPNVYAELYKYDGSTFTLLGSNVAIPEYLTNGTTLSAYYFAIPVSVAALTITDRLAIRIYVNVDGRTVTLHTENNHLCQVVTTFSKGLISLNNLTRQNQFFGTGTSGTDFNISSTTATHTFNIPDASATNRGLITTGTQIIAGLKAFNDAITGNSGIAFLNGVMPPITNSNYSGIGGNSQGISIVTRPVSTNYTNNLYFPSASNSYTFPNATGTIALTSDLTSGTVTSVAALTLGTTGTDLSSTVANGTTTPVITLNVPTASATNRGALSSADWSTFNGKYNLPSLTSGSVLFSNGTTISQNNSNFFWDNTNVRLGIGTVSPSAGVTVYSTTAATQFKAAGTAPAFTFSDTLVSSTYACVFGLATSANHFVTGTAAGDMAIANQSTSAGAIVFGTGTTEKMRMTSTGKLSIGNTNDTYTLDVSGTGRFTGAITGGSSITATGNIRSSNAGATIYSELQNDGIYVTGANLYLVAPATRDMVLYSNDTERMRITSAGNVGIGTSSPASLLTLFDSTTPKIAFQNSGAIRAAIQADSSSLILNSVTGNDIRFQCDSTERMRITSGGNVGIGNTGLSFIRLRITGASNTSSDYSISCVNSVGTDTFYVRNDGLFVTGLATQSPYNLTIAASANCHIYSDGTLFRATSSIRYKSNIENFNVDTFGLINKIRPVWYRSLCERDKKDWSWYGFIAEELAEIDPRFVQFGYASEDYIKDEITNETKLKENAELRADGVMYDRLTVLLIKGMQEQQIQIQNLQEQINILAK